MSTQAVTEFENTILSLTGDASLTHCLFVLQGAFTSRSSLAPNVDPLLKLWADLNKINSKDTVESWWTTQNNYLTSLALLQYKAVSLLSSAYLQRNQNNAAIQVASDLEKQLKSQVLYFYNVIPQPLAEMGDTPPEWRGQYSLCIIDGDGNKKFLSSDGFDATPNSFDNQNNRLWKIWRRDSNTLNLINVGNGKYLGWTQDKYHADFNRSLSATYGAQCQDSDSYQWILQPTDTPYTFRLKNPDGNFLFVSWTYRNTRVFVGPNKDNPDEWDNGAANPISERTSGSFGGRYLRWLADQWLFKIERSIA